MNSNLELMAENNLKVIQNFNLDSYVDSETIQESTNAGDLFMEEYLESNHFELFINSANLKDVFEIKKEKELVDEILKNDICLITIRPEMIHYIDKIETFFKNKNLIPIYSRNHKLNNQQYWEIYHRGITHPNARYSMATRTIVYTSSEVTTIVFKNLKPNDPFSSADYVFNQLKGEAGRYMPNTLRGDLIREEAKRIGLNNLEMDHQMGLAIDPFSTYRNLLKQDSKSQDKLLAYTAVSVHIPNQKELGRDLSVLLDSDQLKSVINNI